MQYQFVLNEIIGSAWWILRPKKMPKIEQASGPKYIPADVGMVEIDAKKMPKIGQALVSKYLPAHVNINDIKHN